MKINIPIYYVVDKKEQIVVAKFKLYYFDCADYFREHASTRRDIYFPHDYIEIMDLKGVAKCFKGDAALGKPADKYDVEFGKKLAKARLIENFYWHLSKYYDKVASDFQFHVIELNKFKDKANQKAFNCMKHVDNLVEKTKQQ